MYLFILVIIIVELMKI